MKSTRTKIRAKRKKTDKMRKCILLLNAPMGFAGDAVESTYET